MSRRLDNYISALMVVVTIYHTQSFGLSNLSTIKCLFVLQLFNVHLDRISDNVKSQQENPKERI